MALEAEAKIKIYKAKLGKERAEQEEIKTAELKKELAPLELIKYFFSFTENLLQRIYRRPHEISPQLGSLYLAGEERKAVELMKRELESIIKQTQKELIKALQDEGYKYKNELQS